MWQDEEKKEEVVVEVVEHFESWKVFRSDTVRCGEGIGQSKDLPLFF
jgi:hypothetical protein